MQNEFCVLHASKSILKYNFPSPFLLFAVTHTSKDMTRKRSSPLGLEELVWSGAGLAILLMMLPALTQAGKWFIMST